VTKEKFTEEKKYRAVLRVSLGQTKKKEAMQEGKLG